jgi:rRNA maturation endonuclease Nob1
MPTNLVKTFAEKTGKEDAEIEKLFKKAKDIVDKEYPNIEKGGDRYWALAVGIVKKMLKLEESMNFAKYYKLIEENPDKDKEFTVLCPSCAKEMNSPKGSNIPTEGTKCPKCGKKMKKKDDEDEDKKEKK